MKRIFFLLFVLLFMCTQVHAKAVKLGRTMNANNSYQSAVKVGSGSNTKIPELIKECDANCQDCDTTTGNCLLCGYNRYISDKLCLICPDKNYCDGKTAVPNCTDVSCLSGSFTEATNTGCCCISNCSGVSCQSGYTATVTANGCCCVKHNICIKSPLCFLKGGFL